MATANQPTKPDWQAIEVEYVNSAITIEELAEKHGVKAGTVRARVHRGKWSEKRSNLQKAVTEGATAKLAKSRQQELAEYNEADLKVAKALRGRIAGLITKSQKSNKDIDPVKLRAMAGALESAQRVARLALGATTENTGLSDPEGGPVKADLTLKEFHEIARQVAADV